MSGQAVGSMPLAPSPVARRKNPKMATSADSPTPIVVRPTATHIPVLDGIRGLAVLLVVFNHLDAVLRPPFTPADQLFVRLSGTTWLGVDLFFVLSGFLITGILLDAKGAPGYFRTFYLRRTLRIFPLYYAFLLAIFVVLPLAGVTLVNEATRAQQGWYWTYLSNVLFARENLIPYTTGHLWSLAVEEQFYLVWPLVVLLLSRARLLRLSIGIVLLLFLARPILSLYDVTWIQFYTLTPFRMDSLAVGAALAALSRSERPLASWRPAAVRAFAAASAASLVLMLYKPLLAMVQGVPVAAVNSSSLAWDPEIQTLRFTAYGVTFGALLVLALTAGPAARLARLFSSPLLRFFGRYSYAIYIVHVPLATVALRLELAGEAFPRVAGLQWPRAILFYVMLVAVSTLFAIASWHLLEKHFLRLKTRFEYAPRVGATARESTETEREAFASP
jgi:peptidoglycan/LPS O-acetylase OafA/YrhL